jgi:hypothetical protein
VCAALCAVRSHHALHAHACVRATLYVTVPQFCWFLTSSFHSNSYYSQELYPGWLAADMKYWQSSLNQSATTWGSAYSTCAQDSHATYLSLICSTLAAAEPVAGKVFGCGAGASPSGYGVDRITDNGTYDEDD